jgi:hypothetical protein
MIYLKLRLTPPGRRIPTDASILILFYVRYGGIQCSLNVLCNFFMVSFPMYIASLRGSVIIIVDIILLDTFCSNLSQLYFVPLISISLSV